MYMYTSPSLYISLSLYIYIYIYMYTYIYIYIYICIRRRWNGGTRPHPLKFSKLTNVWFLHKLLTVAFV